MVPINYFHLIKSLQKATREQKERLAKSTIAVLVVMACVPIGASLLTEYVYSDYYKLNHVPEWQKEEVKEAQLSLVAKEYDDISQKVTFDDVTLTVRPSMVRLNKDHPWKVKSYRTVYLKSEDEDERLKLKSWQEVGGLGHFISPNRQYVYDGYYTFYKIGNDASYQIKNNQLWNHDMYIGDISHPIITSNPTP